MRNLKLNRRYRSEVLRVASAVFAALSGPASDVLHHLNNGDFSSLVRTEMDFSISDLDEFRERYAAVSLLSKYPFVIEGLDRDAVAYEAFYGSEGICAETNSRLAKLLLQPDRLDGDFAIFSRARRKIARLLGSFNWNHAEKFMSFGPGSTTSLPRVRGDAFYKYGHKRPDVTWDCAAVALTAVKRVPLWHRHLLEKHGLPDDVSDLEFVSQAFNIVPGNCVTTVPKSAKTNRVIAIEPDLNMFVQKGIGGLIRRRLKKVGVDLRDQTFNQDLAFVASLTEELTTLDLKAASDSVSLGLCELLLPPDWLEAIKLCRSQFGTMPDGTRLLYRKVSSMGNGFTFELESLIFWALCRATAEHCGERDRRLAVYGDDLIFPVQLTDQIVEVLSYAGFTPNMDKSFWSGPFRESCGKHYFRGVDVTPLYIRKDVNTLPRLVSTCNGLKALAFRFTNESYLDDRFLPAWDHVYHVIPKPLRRKLAGPYTLGDQVLWTEWDTARPSRVRGAWSEGWVVTGLIPRKPDFPEPDSVPYLLRQLSALEFTEEGEGSFGFNPLAVRYQLGKLVAYQWPTLGTWN